MKKIILGSDHAGFSLKEKIKAHLGKNSIDLTPSFIEGDDFPLIAKIVVKEAMKKRTKAILCCGSGNGMCIAANKIKGVRAILARDVGDAIASRRDEDANVLCLGGKTTTTSAADKIVDAFLNTPFANITRYKRRIKQIKELE